MDLQHIPKVELHCHLEGIVDPDMVRRITAAGIEIGVTAKQLEGALPVRDRQGFQRWFDVQQGFASGVEVYRPILAEHVERLRSQNVVYTEIFVAGSEISQPGQADFVDRFRAFREYADTLECGDLQIELIGGWNRRRDAEESEHIGDRLLALHEAGLIAGAFLAGPEEGNPVERFARTFARFRDAGLPVEIHAGEWCGPESVWDALEHGRPRRIGHGVAVFQDPSLLERVSAERIHIELCPTSNLCTDAIRCIEDHPLARARDAGLPFSINTDDPGAFGSTMTSELRLVAEVFGFTGEDLVGIARDSLLARFQPLLRYPNARALTGE